MQSGLIPEPGPVSSQEWIEESKMLTKDAIEQFMPKFSINTDTCIQCHECEENFRFRGLILKLNRRAFKIRAFIVGVV